MKRLAFVFCVITLMLAAVLPASSVQAQPNKVKLKVTEAELDDILDRAKELGDGLKNAFGSGNPAAFEPELLSHFQRPDLSLDVTRSQRKWRRRLKKIERRKRCRKRRNKKSQQSVLAMEAEAADADCAFLCAWASAWAEASCFAIACAECPGGTIRFCSSFSARAYGFGVGVACVNACVRDDAPADPACEAGGVA